MLNPVESGIRTTRLYYVQKFSVVAHVLQLAVFTFISSFFRTCVEKDTYEFPKKISSTELRLLSVLASEHTLLCMFLNVWRQILFTGALHDDDL